MSDERPPQWNFTLAPRACLEQREMLEMSCSIFRACMSRVNPEVFSICLNWCFGTSDASPIRHAALDLLERWTVALQAATPELLHCALYGQSRSSQPDKDNTTTIARVHQTDLQAHKASKSTPAAIEQTATAGALLATEAGERFLKLEHFEYYLCNALSE